MAGASVCVLHGSIVQGRIRFVEVEIENHVLALPIVKSHICKILLFAD